jgi:hypothetical protein
MRAIPIRHCRELKAYTMTGSYVPNYSVGPDLSIFDHEIEHGRRPHGPWTCGLDKQPSKAQIPNLGNLIASITAPNDQDDFRCVDPRLVPS